MLATLLVAGGAQAADWIALGRTDNFRVYLDQSRMERNGDLVQLWQMVDFATAQWVDAQTVVGSIKNLVEYDCALPRFRTLAAEAYSEQMGDGRMVANQRLPNAVWEGVEPGGTAEKTRQLACGKRK